MHRQSDKSAETQCQTSNFTTLMAPPT